MILLPLGHEQETVRRLPWVTFGLMGLCALAFVVTSVGTSHDADIENGLSEAAEYFLSHPYLEPDPRLRELMLGGDDDVAAAQIEVLKEIVERDPETPREAEQEELDRLTERAFAALDAHPFRRYGLVPARAGPVTLMTHMFLHGGWLHLLGNMLFLYLAGPFVEDVWGRPIFAGFYVLSGVAAAVAHMATFPDSSVPMIGASGAIAGVMGAFLVRHATTKIQFFYLVGIWVRGTFWAPAWLMLPLWFVQQVFMASMTSASGEAGGVGYWAHVGGFAFGVAAAFGVRQTRLEERVLQPSLDAKAAGAVLVNAPVEDAQREREQGRPREAWSRLSASLSRNPDDREAALALWDLAREQGWEGQASSTQARLVEAELREGETELALRHWFELAVAVPSVTAEPSVLARIAAVCHERGHADWAGDAVHRLLALPPARVSVTPLLRGAEAVAESDPGLAGRAVEAALGRSDLHPDERARAQALKARLSGAASILAP